MKSDIIESSPKLKAQVYSPAQGSFSLFDFHKDSNSLEIVHWYGCREEFHYGGYTRTTTGFVFAHPNDTHLALVAFLKKIEKKLKLSKEEKIQIRPTGRKDVSLIFPSKWWNEEHIRRTFLTIAIRCAKKYNIEQDNFEEALFSDRYFKMTKKAVQAFLKGRTTYFQAHKQDLDGWVDMFDEENDPDILDSNLQKLTFTK